MWDSCVRVLKRCFYASVFHYAHFHPKKEEEVAFGLKENQHKTLLFCQMQARPLWKCFSPHLREICCLLCLWKSCKCFIRILTLCGKYVTGKNLFLMKKSATMGVLGEDSEGKCSLKMNGNVFQRPTRPLQAYFWTRFAVVNAFKAALPSSSAAGRAFIFELSATTRCLFFRSLCYDWLACSVLLHTGSSLSPPALSASHLSLLIGTACSQKPLIC